MDSTEVAQAKAYGAIILAHGNMAEWAFTNAISIGSGMHLTLANAVVRSSWNTWVVQLCCSCVDPWGMQHRACFPSHLRSAVSVLPSAAQQGILCLLPPEVMCMLAVNNNMSRKT